jgi:hypothetical protein
LATQFFSLLVLLGYLTMFEERNQHKRFPWLSSVVFSLAALTRPEGGLFMAAAGICFFGDVLLNRRRLSSLLLWCLPFILIVGGHFLWRYSYYGFWFPNTFYAKVGGFWPKKGRQYFNTFLGDYKLHWFSPLAVLAVLFRRNYVSIQFLVTIVLYLSYVYYIGGDFLEFRFLIPIFPFVFWLLVDGGRVIYELKPAKLPLRWAAGIAAVCAWAVLLFTSHTFSGTLKKAVIRRGNETVQITGRYGQLRIDQGRALRALVDKGVLPADLRIETGGVGALPYYTQWYTLDKHGLNDVYLAHRPIKRRGQIAHEHVAPLRYLKEKQIAVSLVRNRLLLEYDMPKELKKLEKLKKTRRRTIRKRNAKLKREDAHLKLRLKCLAVAPNQFLVFATNLDEAAFQAVLGHIGEC